MATGVARAFGNSVLGTLGSDTKPPLGNPNAHPGHQFLTLHGERWGLRRPSALSEVAAAPPGSHAGRTHWTRWAQGEQETLPFVYLTSSLLIYLSPAPWEPECGFLRPLCFLWVENQNRGESSNHATQLPAGSSAVTRIKWKQHGHTGRKAPSAIPALCLAVWPGRSVTASLSPISFSAEWVHHGTHPRALLQDQAVKAWAWCPVPSPRH